MTQTDLNIKDSPATVTGIEDAMRMAWWVDKGAKPVERRAERQVGTVELP
jgi:hypothetical protein